MDDQIRLECGAALGLTIDSLEPIQENKYCAIFRAHTPDGPRIIKRYRGNDPALARTEAQALDFYHELARDDPRLLDSGKSLFCPEKNLLGIGFVPGERMSDLLYQAHRDPSAQERLVGSMQVLGSLLRTLRTKTSVPGGKTSLFMFEYLTYCSRRLEQAPLISFCFPGLQNDAAALIREFESCGVTPSFVHGDFVFRNIHIDGDRVGVIDFANTNARSHPLNDIYNLRFALWNMLLPDEFKRRLLGALYDGFGESSCPEAAHRFYFEFHRRRWLMLKLLSRGLKDRLQGLWGLFSFARPYDRSVILA